MRMDPKKVTYADVVKSSSAFLNPGLEPRPLIPKAPRVRLSEEAKLKLRAAIHGDPSSDTTDSKVEGVIQPVLKTEKRRKSGKPKQFVYKEPAPLPITNCSQPLILATASDWVMSGSVMREAIYGAKSVSSSVRLLKPEELGSVVREGMKENPIDICDMSDDECLKSEKQKSYDVYSVDGSDVLVDPDGFDADALFADSIDVFEPISREEAKIFNSPRVSGWILTDSVIKEEPIEDPPAINVSLRLEATDQLRKAKKRMEDVIMDDYVGKIKKFKSDIQEDYEGEYFFFSKYFKYFTFLDFIILRCLRV